LRCIKEERAVVFAATGPVANLKAPVARHPPRGGAPMPAA
jgi:hypothetical protein